ncbi:MAG TPA: hypothetical protein VJ577_08775, partial [Burkholderiaceae bacterium]|nr:hypothetical protein [Burkholderiaceae bacterium]
AWDCASDSDQNAAAGHWFQNTDSVNHAVLQYRKQHPKQCKQGNREAGRAFRCVQRQRMAQGGDADADQRRRREGRYQDRPTGKEEMPHRQQSTGEKEK